MSNINNILSDIIKNDLFKSNSGSYIAVIDLGDNGLPYKFNFDSSSVILPTGTKILYRYQYSNDNINWNSWSIWEDIFVETELPLDLKNKYRYLKFEIKLYGNSKFESPSLLKSVNVYYYKGQKFTVFFQPVEIDINDDQYLSSIHITHEATIPSSSEIKYGYVQFDTTDPNKYFSDVFPLIDSDKHVINLTRYKEHCITDNYIKYIAAGGGWPENSKVEIYKTNSVYPNGKLLETKEYTVNSNEGYILFKVPNNNSDKITICVYMDKVFRIICNMYNYGPEGAVIDHIGVLYNISKKY